MKSIAQSFLITFIAVLILSGVAGLFFGNTALDIQLHDTYFVIAYFHILILLALILGINTLTYFALSKVNSISVDKTFGKIHFLITVVCIFCLIIFIPNLVLSAGPNRYYNFDSHERIFNFWTTRNGPIIVSLILLAVSQFIFVVKLMFGIVKRTDHTN